MEKALYLFCLARTGRLPQMTLEGLSEGSCLTYESIGPVTAVVCEVPLEDFSGDAAESRLQDLAWIVPRALKHGQVIERIMEHSPVLPARFGTLFSSARSLGQALEENIPEIDAYLQSVREKDEWAVKGLMSRTRLRERLGSDNVEQEQSSLASIPPGMRYFKERQLVAKADRDLAEWIKELCRNVATRLTKEASDWNRRAIVARTQEDSGEEIFVNWAFLVDRKQADAFASNLCQVNREYDLYGVHFDLSGPWPPYSFAPELQINTVP